MLDKTLVKFGELKTKTGVFPFKARGWALFVLNACFA
jgi:hypothetical protein